jgi:transposase
MERLVRLSDDQWERLAPLLPPSIKTGGRNAKPHRPVVEAMIWILRTGAPWRDLPSDYGPWQSVYTRFSRWSQKGVLAALMEALARERDGEGYLIDATIVRAHQDASGARKEGASRNRALTRRSVHEDPCRGRCVGQSGATRAFARTNARNEGSARSARGRG